MSRQDPSSVAGCLHASVDKNGMQFARNERQIRTIGSDVHVYGLDLESTNRRYFVGSLARNLKGRLLARVV